MSAPDIATPQQRATFLRMVKPSEDGCLVWTGPLDRDGYGLAKRLEYRGTQQQLAHRISYLLNVGPLVDGMVIDHLCRNRACVNPEHLEQVTQAENVRRYSRTITHCRRAGHSLEDAYIYAGRRTCRECKKQRSRERRAAA